MRVHVVVPDGYDDPGRPSGGNVYDQHLIAGLRDAGWDVPVIKVPVGSTKRVAAAVEALPDGDVVLIDGLLACPAVAALVPQARPVVVLLHMPLLTALDRTPSGAELGSERDVLTAAAAVIVTSTWTRALVLDRYRLDPNRVWLAQPGVDPADPVDRTTSDGSRLLCVAALGSHKGQDLLVAALTLISDLAWECTLVGPTGVDPAYTAQVRDQLRTAGLADRVRLTGALVGPALDSAYARADLLVAPSRSETYGMVVTEALARGLPVVAARVGGLPEALGETARGERPGVLVPPDDAAALAAELRGWLGDPAHRVRLRAAALDRRTALRSWADTASDVASALTSLAPDPVRR